MMRWKAIHLAVGAATLVAPLAAWGQIPMGSVTTDPVQQAPALGMSVVVALAVAMAGVGIYRLRRTGTGRIVGVVLIAAATVLAGLAYAGDGLTTLTISGADCTKRTVTAFSLDYPTQLMSDCPNLIRIVDIQASCDGVMGPLSTVPNVIVECSVGQTLAKGDACRLPGCT
jgi:apolipoprotein N-acyltransferase